MSKRKTVRNILLSVDFYTKPRNLRFAKEFGVDALALVQAVWLAISQEKDYALSKEDTFALPLLLLVPDERTQAVLTAAVERGLLEQDDKFYYNSQVEEHAQNYLGKREADAERKRLERERKKKEEEEAKMSGGHPVDSERLSDGFPTSTYTYTSTNTSLDLNKTDPALGTLPGKSVTKSDPGEGGRVTTPPGQPASPPDGLTPDELEIWRSATSLYAPVAGNEPFLRSNHYIQNGRRPLQKWPHVWLSLNQAFHILKLYAENELEIEEVRRCFERAQSQAQKVTPQGTPPENKDAFGWLTSWILTDTLTLKTAQNRKTNSEKRAAA